MRTRLLRLLLMLTLLRLLMLPLADVAIQIVGKGGLRHRREVRGHRREVRGLWGQARGVATIIDASSVAEL